MSSQKRAQDSSLGNRRENLDRKRTRLAEKDLDTAGNIPQNGFDNRAIKKESSTGDNMELGHEDQNTDGASTSFTNSLGTDMVDVYVGADRKLFRVYRKKFCGRIPRFERLLNESGGAAVNLPNTTAEAFDILVEWVYTDNLRQYTWVCKPGTPNYGTFDSSWDVIELYVLASFLNLRVLMERAIDMRRHVDDREGILPDYEDIRDIYEKTDNSCMMRRYGMQCVLYCLRGDNNADFLYFETQELQVLLRIEDFAVDFIEYSRILEVDDPRKSPDCDYHMHGKDEECAAKKYSKRKDN